MRGRMIGKMLYLQLLRSSQAQDGMKQQKFAIPAKSFRPNYTVGIWF